MTDVHVSLGELKQRSRGSSTSSGPMQGSSRDLARGSRKSFSAGKQVFQSMSNLLTQAKPVEIDLSPPIESQELINAGKEMDAYVEKDPELQTNHDTGLTHAEAAARLAKYGRNELPAEKGDSLCTIFIGQFKDILVILLMTACIVSFALQQFLAASVILVILTLNATLGVWMEYNAGQALDALSNLSGAACEVVREGTIIDSFNAGGLVVGDIVLLPTGCKVPADIRLFSAKNLSVNEIALTGESEPVKKISTMPANRPEDEKKELKEGEKEEATNSVFMGTEVAQGNGKGIVVKTGLETAMGKVSKMIANADSNESPLQMKLEALGQKLGLASVIISIAVFSIGMGTGNGGDPSQDRSKQPHWLQMLLIAVSLTVAAVPEGLPACVTITLAAGMGHMVEKKAFIKKLHSVETLGSASVICTDKTGTLTAGVMTMKRLWVGGKTYKLTNVGYSPVGVVIPMENSDTDESNKLGPTSSDSAALLNCFLGSSKTTVLQYDEATKLYSCTGNNTERPLVVAAAKAGITRESTDKDYTSVELNPFDSTRKRQSGLVKINTSSSPYGSTPFIAIVNGAPNVLLELCVSIKVPAADGGFKTEKLTDEMRATIMKKVDDFSGEAFRVLGTACKPMTSGDDTSPATLECDLVFVGLVASMDPERPGVPQAVSKAQDAGVKVCMITGDYVMTAKAIAKNVGIIERDAPDSQSIDCAELRVLGTEENNLLDTLREKPKDKKSAEADLEKVQKKIDDLTMRTNVYARAKPIDKITIVRSFQRQGHVVAMTGDGVNDGPALAQADIGVAMGLTGTDVARGCADMILTDDNFCSIVDAIEEGRTIYANIGKFCYYLLSTNISEVMLVMASVCGGYPTVLDSVQLLFLNLATDGAPAIALAYELTEPSLMLEGPRSKKEPLIEKLMLTGIVIQTLTLTSVVLSTYITGLYWRFGTISGAEISAKFIYNLTGLDADDIKQQDKYKDDVLAARTMVVFVIVFGELLRAYGARSLRNSVLSFWTTETTVAVHSNKYMQFSVAGAICLSIVVFGSGNKDIMTVFGSTTLQYKEIGFVAGVMWIPFTVDEITKFFYRKFKFGERPKIIAGSSKNPKTHGEFQKLE